MNILALGMLIPYAIFFNGKNLKWLSVYNSNNVHMPIITFVIVLAYIYVYAWVLPRNREK